MGRLEEELDRDAVCHRFCSTCTGSKSPKRLLKGLETSKVGGQEIRSVLYVADHVLLANE